MTNFYIVSGMLYPASGWENGESDCFGRLLVYGSLALAKKVAKTVFLTGGYGYYGYFEASRPSIKAANGDDLNWFDGHSIIACDYTGKVTYC